MSGSSRRTIGRTRSWHGAWRLRRPRGHRSPRLLRNLVLVLSLERVLLTPSLLMMELLLTLHSPQLPKVPRGRSGPRRCMSRLTTTRTSWGP